MAQVDEITDGIYRISTPPGAGAPITFNQFDIANYLHADNKADGSATEQFIFQVTGVEQNGAHVTLPGLGSDFGMYFIVDAVLDPSNGVPLTASLAACLIASMCEMPSWLIGSPSWEMMKRTDLPSGEMKFFMPRLKSAFLNTSGGR